MQISYLLHLFLFPSQRVRTVLCLFFVSSNLHALIPSFAPPFLRPPVIIHHSLVPKISFHHFLLSFRSHSFLRTFSSFFSLLSSLLFGLFRIILNYYSLISLPPLPPLMPIFSLLFKPRQPRKVGQGSRERPQEAVE
ncbi:uncharacterized protein K441DRAFT_74927 [Cenococcum geophilum 1.58]|uniref:uncharacterized protein n=1 Tax=Cenococcum geophilum 1.58 TaxID=794803 RepID=UPI00358FE3B1|nr:hypothetical protein K441DRAFT_74927 [Cenococcum geophilum 1.58]